MKDAAITAVAVLVLVGIGAFGMHALESDPHTKPFFIAHKMGVAKPEPLTDDYRRGVCDVMRLKFRYEGGEPPYTLTINYDDGALSLDCTKD
ncbi:MAG: hypothetical protein JO255_02490 [Alphaproteobacteria bacterium]|nr:hypothetical protein [Alphaproteobacteria bacterium]